MAKYTSGRQKNLKVGISSYSENLTSLEVIGKVGIGTTNPGGRSLYVIGNVEITGVTTLGGVQISPGIVTASPGFSSITYYGDGSKLTGIGTAATSQSVALSTNTTSTTTSLIFSSSPTADPAATLNSNPNLIFNAAVGRLGIGSTNPTATLDIGGDVKISGDSTFSGNVTLGATSSNLINIPGRISSNFYPDGDGTYNVGRAPQIGLGANRWKDANFLGKGTFDGGVDAHDLELGVGSANLIYSTSGNLELNSQSGTTNIDDNVTISGNTGIGTVNPTSKLQVIGNVLISGIVTASSFSGNASTAGYASTAGIATYATSSGIATYATSAGIATYATNAGIATYATSAGISTYATSAGIATYATDAGISTYATSAGIATYATSSGIATYATSSGVSTSVIGGIASVTQLYVSSGISTLGVVTAGNIYSTGIVTASQFSTGSTGIGINTDTISGPAIMYIDPAPVGVGTTSGIVRIRGDLYVDGTQFIVNSTTIELADFNVGIATTVGTDLLLDGAGIGIGSINIRKTFTYNNSANTLESSIGLGVTSGGEFKTGTSTVLTSTTLGSGVVNSSLTSIGTLGQLNVSGVSTFSGITTHSASLFGTEASFTGVVTASSFSGNASSATYATSAGIATYATSAGIATYATSAGIATYATSSGIATYATSSGIATYATSSGIATYATDAGISTYATSAGIATYATSSGISTYAISSGISTYATSSGIATYSTSSGVSTSVIGGIGSITQLQVTGVSTFTNGPVLVGSASSQGTVNQTLQVTGGVYVSGNIGIGTTLPTTKLTISGSTGISFADTNIRIGDSLTGSSITNGINNFFGGSGAGQNTDTGNENVFLGLQAGRTNTTGIQNIFVGKESGYSNTDGYNNTFLGSYAGRENTLGANNNFFGKSAGRSNTIGIFNNFFGSSAGYNNIDGGYNIFLGSYAGQNQTTGSNNVILGSNQNAPDLIGSNQLVIGAGSTAWIYGNSSYNVGLGTTNPTSKLYVVGDGRFTGVVTATSFSGTLSGYASTAGIATYATNAGIATYATNAGIATYATSAGIATYATNAGISTYATSAGIATYATSAGIATYATNAGIATYATSAGIATYATSSGVSTSVIGGIGSITQLSVSGITTTETLNVGTGGTIITTTSDGLVGIGTINPTSALTVQGDVKVSGVSTLGGVVIYSGIITSSNPGISSVVYYGDGSKLTGIGTAASSQSVALSTNTTSTTTSLIFSSSASANPTATINSNPTLIFNAVTSSLGIGTTNPTSTLTVFGDALFSGTGIVTAGIVTATKFYGDGSSLTNINITGNINLPTGINTIGFITSRDIYATGIITANKFYGDGANLTGISASSIVGVITYSLTSGIATSVIGGIASVTQLSVSGISTLGTVEISSGIVTATTGVVTYYGDGSKLTGISASSIVGITSYATSSGVSTSVIGGIGSITQLQVTGISTFVNGPVLIGGGTSTGTTNQILQVGSSTTIRGAYISGSLGIGTTNPTTKVEIDGVLGFSGSNVRIGDNTTGANLTSGLYNNFIGVGVGSTTTSGSYNNFLGFTAGGSNDSGNYNNFFGCQAGYYNVGGSYNNFFGRYAGYQNQNGTYNNFLGHSAGRYNTGNNNNFVGSYAGQTNSTGNYNNFFGFNAGRSNTTGNRNIFLGNYTGRSTTASYKVVFGSGLNGTRLFDSPNIAKDKQFAVGLNSTGTSEYWIVGNENFNIGIGTTNPTSRLYVGGDVLVTGVVTATTFYGDGSQLSGIGSAASVVLSPNTSSTATSIVFSEFSSANPASQLNSNPNLVFNASTSSLGIGTTNPTSKLWVGGDGYFTGILTANRIYSTIYGEFTGGGISGTNIVGTALSIAGISTLGSVQISSGIVTATSGIVTYYGDGSKLTGISASSIVGFATYASISGVSTSVIGGIGSITALTVSGVSTFGQISVGGTTGENQYVLSSTGTGLSWQPVTAVGGGILNGIIIQDEGSIIGTAGSITTLNFVGNNISVSAVPLGIAATITVSDTPNFTTLAINGTTDYGSITATTTSVSQVGIHSALPTSTYRSVEYTIQATQGTNFHATKILALHNGTIAYNSEYGTIYNNTSVGTFDVDISGGNIRLLVTPASASSTTYTINFIATEI